MGKTPKGIQIARDNLADEIRQLRSKVEFLEKRNKELEQIHQLDMAEIVYQRRIIDSLVEVSHE